jgi:hypothetical protein
MRQRNASTIPTNANSSSIPGFLGFGSETHFWPRAPGHEWILRHQKLALFVPTFKLVQRLLEDKNRSTCVIVSPFTARGFLGMTVMS